jgi:hypothetical protein
LSESLFVASALSGCFALSAAAKLAQPEPFEAFLQSLLPRVLVRRWMTVGLATTEIVVAALLVSPSRWFGALGAAALSIGFVGASLKAWRAAAPGCGCFGGFDADSPHWVTLTRAATTLTAATYCVIVLAGAHRGTPGHAVFISTLGFAVGSGVALTMTLVGRIVEFHPVLRGVLETEGGTGA